MKEDVIECSSQWKLYKFLVPFKQIQFIKLVEDKKKTFIAVHTKENEIVFLSGTTAEVNNFISALIQRSKKWELTFPVSKGNISDYKNLKFIKILKKIQLFMVMVMLLLFLCLFFVIFYVIPNKLEKAHKIREMSKKIKLIPTKIQIKKE